MNYLKHINFKLIFIVAIVIITLTQCYTSRITNELEPYGRLVVPPGVVRVDTNNFYMDTHEITNFSWYEYVYWISKVYGYNSEKHKSVQPNIDLWKIDNNCHKDFGQYYNDHPVYQNYPVVGISQEQAKDFCIWRTNIVFQYFLIREDVLTFPNQDSIDSTNYFTIEKYFNGDYTGIEPDTNFMTYALYELPTYQEWNNSQFFFLNTYVNVDGNFNLNDSSQIHYNKLTYCDSTMIQEPTINTRYAKKYDIITHMYGNVAEWLKEDDKIIGGSWKDSVTTNFNELTIQKYSSTAVGFRCVCKWVKYEE